MPLTAHFQIMIASCCAQVLPLDGQQQVVSELATNEAIAKCCYDSNGNHVIQKCIERIKPSNHIAAITQVRIFSGCNNCCDSFLSHPSGCPDHILNIV